MNASEFLTALTTHYNALVRTYAQQLSLTSSQAFLLLNIPYDGTQMSSLAYKLGIDNSTLTRNINKLQLLNLIIKMQDKHDRRVINIYITDEGQKNVEALEAFFQNLNNSLVEHIDIDDQNIISEALEKLLWAMECARQK